MLVTNNAQLSVTHEDLATTQIMRIHVGENAAAEFRDENDVHGENTLRTAIQDVTLVYEEDNEIVQVNVQHTQNCAINCALFVQDVNTLLSMLLASAQDLACFNESDARDIVAYTEDGMQQEGYASLEGDKNDLQQLQHTHAQLKQDML